MLDRFDLSASAYARDDASSRAVERHGAGIAAEPVLVPASPADEASDGLSGPLTAVPAPELDEIDEVREILDALLKDRER
jgi:hypothetical protein